MTAEQRSEDYARDWWEGHRRTLTRRAKERLLALVTADLRTADADLDEPWQLLKHLRADGWSVAVHNDYLQDDRAHTFWLFTKGGAALKGEGETDGEALRQVWQQAGRPGIDECTHAVTGGTDAGTECLMCGAILRPRQEPPASTPSSPTRILDADDCSADAHLRWWCASCGWSVKLHEDYVVLHCQQCGAFGPKQQRADDLGE